MERRLAAILIADVVGYTRLSQIDEERTRAQFQAVLHGLFLPAIREHRGRVVKTTGDGLLVEFRSVVDALRCAIQVQKQKGDWIFSGSPEARMAFRIGINIGDILVEGDDIHGDGVNIAQRIETMAEPGGIAISGSAYEQVKSKVLVDYVALGARRVKGGGEPVRVYHVRLDEVARSSVLRYISWWRSLPWHSHPWRAVAFFSCLLAVAVTAWWQPWSGRQFEQPVVRLAYPLPEKPSVAVLPFINVSGEEAQDHLAEGLTDDLITELSKVSGVFVIARHSVFAVRSASATVQDIAARLGVQYVLEGTLQRDGARLRINVKLIEAMTGLSLWGERYDRQYSDLFAVQDDVIGKIISALSIKLSRGEQTQLARMPTESLEAYDHYMRAEHEGLIYGDVNSYRRTLSFYQKAIDLDPGFAGAHAGIARVAVDVWRNDYNFLWSAAVARKIAYDAAGQALKLDPLNARAHTVLALLQWVDGRQAEALESARTAIAAQPNDAEAYGTLALLQVHTGDRDQGLANIKSALRLDPSPAAGFQLLGGIVFYMARDNERAIPLIENAAPLLPRTEPAREYLAAAYASGGNKVRAAEEAANLLTLFPESNLTYYSYLYDYWTRQELDYHLAALEAAGIPKWPFGYKGDERDRLTEMDLRNLIDSRTWSGRNRNGTQFVQYFDRSGKTAYRSANVSITGVFEIQGYRLCERFDGYFLDRLVCGEVYRNHENDENGATFVHVTPRSLQVFSVSSESR
ncbi:adenylate/guanylate cyclase domain-containing protein [Aliirhizobium smilacinae]|uniref:Adenylate cyclase n=1 Tax=Aliirhizobium smilacinae TaxID=1395944 RepID=A0A5C4X9V2_9HYPH|nr:adenylate/guanylate cyclase domain-containing protein [Rhizobium smilacinae]TNM60236.1 adenylate cyclase [Rhizobium smilacinae]